MFCLQAEPVSVASWLHCLSPFWGCIVRCRLRRICFLAKRAAPFPAQVLFQQSLTGPCKPRRVAVMRGAGCGGTTRWQAQSDADAGYRGSDVSPPYPPWLDCPEHSAQLPGFLKLPGNGTTLGCNLTRGCSLRRENRQIKYSPSCPKENANTSHITG